MVTTYHITASSDRDKKDEKRGKKVLTKGGRGGILTKLSARAGGSVITDDDKQFFDGFHLDERYGLPEWTQELFGDIAR